MSKPNVTATPNVVKITAYSTPLDALVAVGTESFSSDIAHLITSFGDSLWRGNRVLNTASGHEYKLFCHTGVATSDAQSSDWSYTTEYPEIVHALAVSNGTIGSFTSVLPANFYGSDTLVTGGIYLVANQTNAYENGLYMVASKTGSYGTFARLQGYSDVEALHKTSVYVPYKSAASDYTGTLYRMKSGNVTSSDFKYYKDDYINNGALIPNHSTKRLALASDYIFVAGNNKFTVTSDSTVKVGTSSDASDVFYVTGTTGNVFAKGTLNVGGAVILSDTLTVTKNGTFSSDLTVDKNLTVRDNVTVSDSLVVGGSSTFENSLIVGSTLTVSDTFTAEKFVRTGYATYTSVTDIDFSKGNVFYYHLASGGTIGCLQSVGGSGISDISNYLGGSFCVTIVNGGETSINVRLSDTIFTGITDTSDIALAAGAGLSYTGIITGIRGSSTTYGLHGVIAPSYQNLMS